MKFTLRSFVAQNAPQDDHVGGGSAQGRWHKSQHGTLSVKAGGAPKVAATEEEEEENGGGQD